MPSVCNREPHLIMTLAIDPDTSIADRDPDLWLLAQCMTVEHRFEPSHPSRCVHPSCPASDGYPCRGRRLANRALAASTGPWPMRWTFRIDAASLGLHIAPACKFAELATPGVKR
jgi:hypothetical protein